VRTGRTVTVILVSCALIRAVGGDEEAENLAGTALVP
jgi:hypothetical protein